MKNCGEGKLGPYAEDAYSDMYTPPANTHGTRGESGHLASA